MLNYQVSIAKMLRYLNSSKLLSIVIVDADTAAESRKYDEISSTKTKLVVSYLRLMMQLFFNLTYT